MKKKLNPRHSVGDILFPLQLYSMWKHLSSARTHNVVGLTQELMPWDHPFLSGVLRAERLGKYFFVFLKKLEFTAFSIDIGKEFSGIPPWVETFLFSLSYSLHYVPLIQEMLYFSLCCLPNEYSSLSIGTEKHLFTRFFSNLVLMDKVNSTRHHNMTLNSGRWLERLASLSVLIGQVVILEVNFVALYTCACARTIAFQSLNLTSVFCFSFVFGHGSGSTSSPVCTAPTFLWGPAWRVWTFSSLSSLVSPSCLNTPALERCGVMMCANWYAHVYVLMTCCCLMFE